MLADAAHVLYSVAMETRIGICDYPGGDPRTDTDMAAIVADGNLIALNSTGPMMGCAPDVLAMALEVATVMTDRPDGRPGTFYAPAGSSSSPGPGPGPGRRGRQIRHRHGPQVRPRHPIRGARVPHPQVECHTPGLPGRCH